MEALLIEFERRADEKFPGLIRPDVTVVPRVLNPSPEETLVILLA